MCKRNVYLWCICIRWFDLERCSFLPANMPIPSRGLLGLISRLTSASRLCSELARSPEQALTASCNHVGASLNIPQWNITFLNSAYLKAPTEELKMKPHRCNILRNMLRTRAALSQQIDCATARTRSVLFHPTWSVMLSTPISQTQPGRSSFMRDKLGGILRCATVSTFQTTPIAGWKEKCGLDLSLLLSVFSVCSDEPGYDGRGPPTGFFCPGKWRRHVDKCFITGAAEYVIKNSESPSFFLKKNNRPTPTSTLKIEYLF